MKRIINSTNRNIVNVDIVSRLLKRFVLDLSTDIEGSAIITSGTLQGTVCSNQHRSRSAGLTQVVNWVGCYLERGAFSRRTYNRLLNVLQILSISCKETTIKPLQLESHLLQQTIWE